MTGLVDDATIRWMVDEPAGPLSWRPGADPAVADLVGDRFGDQVVTRSVDPLLAGVYAGSAATIGLRSAVPTLAAVLDRGAPSLTRAVREALPPPTGASVFGAIDGGYTVLLDELVRCADFHWAQVGVERLDRRDAGWRLVDDEGGDWHADAVLLAVPAPRLATIVAEVAPRTAAAARQITTASTALVALALPGGTPLPELPVCSSPAGTPARQGDHAVVAQMGRARQCRTGPAVVRPLRRRHRPAASAMTTCCPGRPRTWRRSSASPTNRSTAGCSAGSTRCRSTGRATADLVAEVRAGLPRSLAVAGGYLDGIGVPACIAAATRAAASLVSARVAR